MGNKNLRIFRRILCGSNILIFIFFILCGCESTEYASESGNDSEDTFEIGDDDQSSNEIKESILSTYLIRTLKIIYPKGDVSQINEDGSLQDLTLNEYQRKEMEKLYNELLKQVIKFHRKKYGGKIIRPRLRIISSDDEFSGVTDDNTIVIDTKIVLSAFLGAVRSQEEEDDEWEEDEITESEADLTFDQILHREILDFQSSVELLESEPTYDAEGDLLLFETAENPAEIFLTHPITKMRLNEVGLSFSVKRYEATVLFILAHEYGHIVLDHARSRIKSRIGQEDYCKQRYGVEIEADVYAAKLLSQHMTLDNSRLFDNLIRFSGESIFFESVYYLAGYDENQVRAECDKPYPSIETRTKFSGGDYQIDLKSNNKELWSDIDRSYLEHISQQ
jgi:hypothetical protein